MHLYYDFTYNSSALVESTDGATWEDPEVGFIKFAVKRALKKDQTLHMEGTLHVILYFREECSIYYTIFLSLAHCAFIGNPFSLQIFSDFDALPNNFLD